MNHDEWLKAEFDRVWPWLKRSLDKQPIATHDKEHVLESLLAGRSMLWPTAHAAVITEETTYPNGNRVLFAWLAGGKLSELEKAGRFLETVAKQRGCIAFAMIVVRDGFTRVFGDYQKAGSTIVKGLG